MEALVTLITTLGLAGSVSLAVWGLVLCVRHGFDPVGADWAA
jgi:hypothetical protein